MKATTQYALAGALLLLLAAPAVLAQPDGGHGGKMGDHGGPRDQAGPRDPARSADSPNAAGKLTCGCTR